MFALKALSRSPGSLGVIGISIARSPVACFNISQCDVAHARTRAFCMPFYGHRLAKVVRSRLHACVTRRVMSCWPGFDSRYVIFKPFVIYFPYYYIVHYYYYISLLLYTIIIILYIYYYIVQLLLYCTLYLRKISGQRYISRKIVVSAYYCKKMSQPILFN